MGLAAAVLVPPLGHGLPERQPRVEQGQPGAVGLRSVGARLRRAFRLLPRLVPHQR